jgi:uncharacterized protein YjbI with pentapeptide repeats
MNHKELAEVVERHRLWLLGDTEEGRRAKFTGLDLYTEKLEGVDLRFADFSQADLSSAKIKESNLEHANMSEAVLTHVEFHRVNLGHVNLRNASCAGSTFYYARLEQADAVGADFGYSRLVHSDLTDAALDQANFRLALFEHCTFRGASMKRCNLWSTRSIASDFSNGDLSFADLTNATLERARFHRANLRHARLPMVFFRGMMRVGGVRGVDLGRSRVNWLSRTTMVAVGGLNVRERLEFSACGLTDEQLRELGIERHLE